MFAERFHVNKEVGGNYAAICRAQHSESVTQTTVMSDLYFHIRYDIMRKSRRALKNRLAASFLYRMQPSRKLTIKKTKKKENR